MGAFFTNVQVFTGDRAAIVAAVRDHARGSGYTLAAEGQASDRTIAVSAAEGGWIAVYDEATEDQHTASLEALAAALSRALSAAAVTVLVHDSDVLEMRLFEGGERVDLYVNNPGYFTGKKPSKKDRERTAGHEERWAKLLQGGASPADLRAAWDGGKLFAEHTLARAAALLGIRPDRAGVGYRYLAPDDDEVIRLGFVLEERPAHEQKASGRPRFQPAAYNPVLDTCVGDRLSLATSVLNHGGASKGLRLVVFGPAIDADLLAPTKVTLTTGSPQNLRRVEVPIAPGIAGTSRLFVAEATDFEISPGLADMTSGIAPGQLQRGLDAWFSTQIHAIVECDVKAPGSAKIHVGYVPLEDPEGGQTSHTTLLQISLPFRRPLRSAAGVESHLLRPLATETTLFALLCLDAARAEDAARFAADAMERWAELIAGRGEGKYRTTLFPADATSAPKSGSLQAKGVPGGKRWKEIREILGVARAFSASLPRARAAGEDESPLAPHDEGHGFSLSRGFFPREGKGDPSLPHLGLWMGLGEQDGASIARAEALLASLADAALERGILAQAIVGRWGWRPELSVDSTPYEIASGVHGQCTLQRSWCRRFLRGVTGQGIWLGPHLLGRIGDTSALAAVAECAPIGAGLRVRLRSPADIDALERALAPILPGSDDWTAGLRDG